MFKYVFKNFLQKSSNILRIKRPLTDQKKMQSYFFAIHNIKIKSNQEKCHSMEA